jgi:cytidylate kinase
MFVTTAGVPRVEDDEATIARLTERVITEAAREGRVVLVGRGAQAVLARRPDALHVLLIASKAFRERVAVERLDVAADRVADVVAQTDRERDRYVRAHYDRDRRDPLNYDLVINTERTGFDGAAALIATEVRRRGWAA